MTGTPPKTPPNLTGTPLDAEWAYTSDYLKGCSLKPNLPGLSHTKLSPHLTNSPRRPQPANMLFRTQTLKALIRLRSMKSMSGLARAIPLRWQTRIKTWLNS